VTPDGQEVVLPDVWMDSSVPRPRLLPDGSGVVYQSNRQLWLFEFAKKTNRQLTALAGGGTDGRIGVFDVTADGKLVFDRRADNSDVLLIKLPR
jgi:hypothetical protein